MIPDNDAEALESDTLKLDCQFGQTNVYYAQRKYLEALNEIRQAFADSKHIAELSQEMVKRKLEEFKWVKARVQLDLQQYAEARDTLSEIAEPDSERLEQL